ncbi:DUF2199 domain-containing protein [Duganella sp. SG902]|uniref:DUF2199 domain-containing protein n=1 Tax=Duganella sp. SG902 TaxID=2587016 RepID=UPI00159DAB9D
MLDSIYPHQGAPLAEVVKLSAEDRARQVAESSDLCIIEGKRFFIRALLPLLVKPQEYPYYIGLWVEVSQANFERVYQLWDSEDQIYEPPFSAQIANEIPGMDGSLVMTQRFLLNSSR